MPTYLLTYNPKYWHWDDIQDCINAIRQTGYYADGWTCGHTRAIQPGDRLYLIQLGREPRGIFASGKAVSPSYEREHWIESKRLQGRLCCYVDYHLDVLLDPDRDLIFPYEKLMDDYPQVRWAARSSGVRIPDEVAARLEVEWQRFLAETSANGLA